MIVTLDSASPEPLYQQIVRQVRARILSGQLDSGALLPSIRQLAADLVTSVITTKRAYQDLEAAGLIETRAGRGTFVRPIAEPDRAKLRLVEVEECLREAVRVAQRVAIGRGALAGLLDAMMQTEGLKDG